MDGTPGSKTIDGPQTLSIRVYDIHRTESVLGEDVKRERSVEEMV